MIPDLVIRPIEGISAVLLPYTDAGRIDEASYQALVARTYDAGLVPAVNMDTGYTNLLTEDERARVLALARDVAAGRRFVAGAFIEGGTGDPVRRYQDAIAAIVAAGGTPILFQCSELASASDDEVVRIYDEATRGCQEALAFELGQMFAPFGRIYSTELFARLMALPALVGAKHSSLDRRLEWDRLALRDRVRPDFRIYTGNDLAIDMVFFGSDYLLGLSAFAVEAFAQRDRWWAEGDTRAFRLNDVLQYLGHLAFRAPVPAYKHSCAQFLALRGRIPSSAPHPQGARRPESDLPLLEQIAHDLDRAMDTGAA